jgi:hypothetical protein
MRHQQTEELLPDQITKDRPAAYPLAYLVISYSKSLFS